jgi:hypothetical protein
MFTSKQIEQQYTQEKKKWCNKINREIYNDATHPEKAQPRAAWPREMGT